LENFVILRILKKMYLTYSTTKRQSEYVVVKVIAFYSLSRCSQHKRISSIDIKM